MRMALLDEINPFVKGITVIVCGILLAFTSSWKMNVITMLVCLMALALLSHCKWSPMIKILLPTLLIAAAVFVSGLRFGQASGGMEHLYSAGTLPAALLMSTRILAYVALGILFMFSTNQDEFVMSLMQQAKLKPKFAYGVLAAVHLLPVLQREWQEVRLAYQVRGYKTGIFSFGPLFNTLVNSIRWSENVAMAMESKGFDGDGTRTFAITTTVKFKDIIFCIICISLTITGMILI